MWEGKQKTASVSFMVLEPGTDATEVHLEADPVDRAADLAEQAFRMMLKGEDPTHYFRADEFGRYQPCYVAMLDALEEDGAEAARAVLMRFAAQDGEIGALRVVDPALHKYSWTVGELYSAEFPEPRYIVPGLLPSGLAALGARPKIGKSWMGLQISVAVGTGGMVFNQQVSKGKVLYLALEDSPRRMKKRLQKQASPANADIRFEFGWKPLLEEGMSELVREIDKYRYTLVVVDTLARALGYLDPNKQAEMNVHLGVLQRTAVDRNMTILLIDHHRKNNGGNSDVVDDLIGATAKSGVLDVAMGLYRERGEKNATLQVTGRDIDERELAMRFDRDTGCWQCLGDAAEVGISEKEKKILEVIAKMGAPTYRELIDMTGQDRGNCFKLIQELIVKGKVRQIDGRPARYMLVMEKEAEE